MMNQIRQSVTKIFFLTGMLLLPVVSMRGLQMASEFESNYIAVGLGSITGVPTNYGGLTINPANPSFLYIGGSANTTSGAVYRVPLNRDGEGHIIGFGEADFFAAAPRIDGGLVFAPNGNLLFTRYPINDVGQILPGSDEMDVTQDLTGLGVASSVGSLNFVPEGFLGAGNLVFASYNGNSLHTVPYSEDGGVYLFGNVTNSVSISGGPEGITHVPQGSALFPNPSMLVSAYSAGAIVAYEVDAHGLPIPETARNFITGLSGAEGAALDPVTGDFLFSTFGGGSQVVRVTGFIPEPSTYALIFGLLSASLLVFHRRRKG